MQARQQVSRDMVFHMKTTLMIDDQVMLRLKQEAAARKVTMSELVEAGLRQVLVDKPGAAEAASPWPELPGWDSGGALVDIADRAALEEAMGGDEREARP
jgi:hypothetical protein